MRTAFAVAVTAWLGASLGACQLPLPVYAPDPIPLTEAGTGGGVLGMGTAADITTPFPMLVDTATPVTTYASTDQTVSATRGTVRLYADDGTAASQVPRLELDDVQLFSAPLAPTGFDAPTPIGGVLGGDNLSRFALGISFDPSPVMQISDNLILSDCEVGDRCGAVLPFTADGGHQLIDIGEAIYSYPASYVLLDACVEPMQDPLEPELACGDPGCLSFCPQSGTERADCVAKCTTKVQRGCDAACLADATAADCVDCLSDAQRYLSHGVDVRFVIATGFPGVALTVSAYDRLRGTGAGDALIASAPHQLFLPGQSGAITVGLGSLGLASTTLHDSAARSAMALVGHREYFGACDEMARSRRLRRVPDTDADHVPATDAECLRWPGRFSYPNQLASGAWELIPDPLLEVCDQQNGSGGVCDDRSGDSHTTAYVELEGALPILVVPDTTSLLQAINADVRTDSSTVEGVIGTGYLQRFGTTIDYPGNRVVMTCANAACRSFPQSNHGTDCSTPDPDLSFGGAPARVVPGGGCATPLPVSTRETSR